MQRVKQLRIQFFLSSGWVKTDWDSYDSTPEKWSENSFNLTVYRNWKSFFEKSVIWLLKVHCKWNQILVKVNLPKIKMRRMTGGGSFRYTKWDPFLILSQMSALQCIYYVSLGLWIFFFDVLSGDSRSLDHIFKYQTLLASQWHGKLLIAAFLFNALTW